MDCAIALTDLPWRARATLPSSAHSASHLDTVAGSRPHLAARYRPEPASRSRHRSCCASSLVKARAAPACNGCAMVSIAVCNGCAIVERCIGNAAEKNRIDPTQGTAAAPTDRMPGQLPDPVPSRPTRIASLWSASARGSTATARNDDISLSGFDARIPLSTLRTHRGAFFLGAHFG